MRRQLPPRPAPPPPHSPQTPSLNPFRSSAALAVTLVALVLLVPGGYSGRNSPAVASFIFPAEYSAPPITALVGAQGVVGPNVPTAGLGPSLPIGSAGAQGHLGPVNLTTPWVFSVTAASLTVHVLNGTARSNSNSGHASVTAENLSSGRVISATTAATGLATLVITEGWFLLTVTPTGSTYDAFREQLDVLTATPSVTVYAVPAAGASVTVSNGPSAVDTAYLYASVEPTWAALGLAAVNVSLLNESSAGTPIATATTPSNGTVLFAKVNPVYSYALFANGYNLSATNVRYGDANYTTATFALTAGTDHQAFDVAPLNSWTATITGTVLTAAGYVAAGPPEGFWLIGTRTLVSGGTILMGSDVAGLTSTLETITFQNTVVYFDNANGDGWDPVRFAFVNSTVIMLAQAGEFRYGGVPSWFNNTAYVGGAVASAGLLGGDSFTDLQARASVIYGMAALNSGGSVTTGNFTDTEFLNFTDAATGELGFGGVNLNAVTFSNAHMAAEGAAGWLNATDVVTLNSTFAFNGIPDQIRDSYWNFTATPYDFNQGFQSIVGDRVSAQLAKDLVTTAVAAGIPYATTDAAVQASPSGLLTISLPGVSNLTETILRDTAYPDVNTSFICNFPTTCAMAVYDSELDVNETIAHLQTFAVTLGPEPAVPDVRFQAFGHLWLNYSIVNLAAMSYVYTQNGNATFAHDTFPWVTATTGYYFQQSFVGLPTEQHDVLLFSNDSFAFIYDNSSITRPISYFENGYPASVDYLNNYNDAPHETTRYTAVNHSTFRSPPAEAYLSSGTDGLVMIGENLVTSVLSHDLFLNEPAYNVGPSAGFVAPYGPDVEFSAGTGVIEDCWFYGLSNVTVPIAENADTPHGQGWGGDLTLRDDHFFYAPRAGQTEVDPLGEIYPTQVAAGGHVDPYTGIANSSTVTYELPVGWNTSLTFASGPQLVSNLSVVQSTPAGLTWRATRSWSIAPDVNPGTGTPMIGYANGGEGGPQPNFEWAGYNYSESVEPTYVELGASSISAPPVDAFFANLVPLAEYSVVWYDAATGVQDAAQTVESSALGTLSAAYAPSVGHAQVIAASCAGICVAGSGYGASNSGFLGIPYVVWFLLVLLVLAVAVGVELGRRRP